MSTKQDATLTCSVIILLQATYYASNGLVSLVLQTALLLRPMEQVDVRDVFTVNEHDTAHHMSRLILWIVGKFIALVPVVFSMLLCMDQRGAVIDYVATMFLIHVLVTCFMYGAPHFLLWWVEIFTEMIVLALVCEVIVARRIRLWLADQVQRLETV